MFHKCKYILQNSNILHNENVLCRIKHIIFTSKSQAKKLILVDRLLLSLRLFLSTSLIPEKQIQFNFGGIWSIITWQGSIKSVSEAKYGPVKDGNDEDEAELCEVNYCSSWTEKRALELSPRWARGQEKVVEIKPVEIWSGKLVANAYCICCRNIWKHIFGYWKREKYSVFGRPSLFWLWNQVDK